MAIFPQYQNYYQQPMQQPQQPCGYTCRCVSSREEAFVSPTDFLSPGTVLIDMAHGAIYLKRFNPNTGGADFLDFKCAAPEQQVQPRYVTFDEFEAFKAELKPKKGAKKDDE